MSIIRFRLNSNPYNNQEINFNVDVPGLVTETGSVTFKNVVTNIDTQCLIGANVEQTRNNLKSWAENYVTNVVTELQPYSNVSGYIDLGSNVVDINIMYYVNFRFTFSPSRNPITGQLFQLDIKKNSTIYKNLDKTFNDTVNSPFYIIIGNTTDLTTYNILSNFDQYNSNSNITHSLSSIKNFYGYKELYLDISDTADANFTKMIYTNNSGYDITGPVKIPVSGSISEYVIGGEINTFDLRVRSPYIFSRPFYGASCSTYLLINPSTQSTIFSYTDCATNQLVTQVVPASSNIYSYCALEGTINGLSYSVDSQCSDNPIDFNSIIYNIKSWKGDLNNYTSNNSQLIEYDKEKLKVVGNQDSVFINLSNLFRYKLEGDVNKYIEVTSLTQSTSIGFNESRWGYVSGHFENNSENTNRNFTSQFYILDGYVEPNENQVLNRVLLTNNNTTNIEREFAYGSIGRIHFKTEGLLEIRAYEGGSYANPYYDIVVNATSFLSYDYINSIRVDTTQNMIYSFGYDNGTSEIVKTYVYDSSCKYNSYDVIFKNKWGVLETVTFNKKSSRSLSVDNDKYLRGIVDYNGNYDITRHTNKNFNTKSYTEITLNTDFVSEFMNDTFTELMNSEEIWVIDPSLSSTWGSRPIPVNRNETSFSYKTHLNDKLIQYTMKFKFSHDTINNIL